MKKIYSEPSVYYEQQYWSKTPQILSHHMCTYKYLTHSKSSLKNVCYSE